MGDGVDPVSSNSDSYTWGGPSGGLWSVAANWSDLTTGENPASAVPGSLDPVTIVGPSGSSAEVIGGGGNSASLKLSGLVGLSGQYGTGELDVGTVQGAPNSASFTLGNLALTAGSGLTAATVNVIDGSLGLSGGGSLSASGAVSVGSANGSNITVAGASYSYSSGASGTITVGSGA